MTDYVNVHMPKDERVAKLIKWMNERARDLRMEGEVPADVCVLAVAGVHQLYPSLSTQEMFVLATKASEQIHAWLKLNKSIPKGSS